MEGTSAGSVSRSRRDGYLSRLRRSWLPSAASSGWLLLGLMPLLFFQTTVHEGSHCVVFAVSGIGCRVLAPFPVMMSFGALHGVTFSGNDDAEAPVLAIIAPQLVAAALVCALLLARRRVRDERWAVLQRLWLLGACLDLLNNTFWAPHGRFGDWSVMASQVGLSPPALFAASLPMWLIGLAGLLTPLPAEHVGQGASPRGLSEIGLGYALISALAICVSVAVEVPDSEPASPWHRVPILLHAVTVVVCLALVAASRRTRTRRTRREAA
ncbi:MAG: hypothetical protein ACHQ6T_04735 [Myxococcota bacterium]